MQNRSGKNEQQSERVPAIIADEISQIEHSLATAEERKNTIEHIERMSVELLKLSKNLNGRLLTHLLTMTVQEARVAKTPGRIDIARL